MYFRRNLVGRHISPLAAILACLLIALAAGCNSSEPSNPGLLAYRVLDSSSRGFTPEVAMSDLAGKELRRVALAEPVQQLLATEAGHQALARTESGKIYLVDAVQGKAQALDIPAEAQRDLLLKAPQFALGSGKRWLLLGDTLMRRAYLVNLSTGQVTDLAALSKDANFIGSGILSPTEDYVVQWIDKWLWLVPTADPGKARKLGGGQETYAGSFSADGKQVVYTRLKDKGADVVVEQVDGSASRAVATGDTGNLHAGFVPGQNQLVIVRPEKATLLSLDGNKEQDLLTYSATGQLGPLMFSSSGQKLLFGTEASGSKLWQLVDLKAGTAKQLDALKGLQPYFQGTTQRWLAFIDNMSPGGNAHFVGLDTESGDTHQALTLDEKSRYLGQYFPSSDGAYGLVVGQGAEKQQLWLLSNKGGEPRMLAEGTFVSGAFSPDSRQVVVSKGESSGTQRLSKLSLADTEGTGTQDIGSGIGAVWLRP